MCLFRHSPPPAVDTPMSSKQEEPRVHVLSEPPVTEVTDAAAGTQYGDHVSESATIQSTGLVQPVIATLIEEGTHETAVETYGNPPTAASGGMVTPLEIEETSTEEEPPRTTRLRSIV